MDKPIAYMINESVSEAVECSIIKEDGEFVVAEGILQQGEKINRNKRFYATEDLRREIYGPRVTELVTTGNFKGEAGHPIDMNLTRQQKIDPTLEQVWYTKLWMEGSFVKGRFRGTNNDLGRSFNNDLKDGQKPSFSLRSLGTLSTEHGQSRVTNLRVITYDRVYFPSYDNAYTERVLSESANMQQHALEDFVKSKGNIQNIDESYELIAPIVNADIVDLLMKESANMNILCNDFNPRSTSVSRDGKSVTMITEDYQTIIMPTDNYLDKVINDYCSKNF